MKQTYFLTAAPESCLNSGAAVMLRRTYRLFSAHRTHSANHRPFAATGPGFPRPRHKRPDSSDDDGFPQNVDRPRPNYIQYRGTSRGIAQLHVVCPGEHVDTACTTRADECRCIGDAIPARGGSVSEAPHEDDRHNEGCDVKEPVHRKLECRVIKVVEIRGDNRLQVQCQAAEV